MYKTTKINRYGSFSQNNSRINASRTTPYVYPEGIGSGRRAAMNDGRLKRWKQAMLIRLKRATEGNTNGKK